MKHITGLHSKETIIRYEKWLVSKIKGVTYIRLQEGKEYRLEIQVPKSKSGKLNYIWDYETGANWMEETLYPLINISYMDTQKQRNDTKESLKKLIDIRWLSLKRRYHELKDIGEELSEESTFIYQDKIMKILNDALNVLILNDIDIIRQDYRGLISKSRQKGENLNE